MTHIVLFIFAITVNNYIYWTIGFVLLVFLVSGLIAWLTLRERTPKERKEGTHGTYP